MAGVTLSSLLADGDLEILYEFRFISEDTISIAENGKHFVWRWRHENARNEWPNLSCGGPKRGQQLGMKGVDTLM